MQTPWPLVGELGELAVMGFSRFKKCLNRGVWTYSGAECIKYCLSCRFSMTMGCQVEGVGGMQISINLGRFVAIIGVFRCESKHLLGFGDYRFLRPPGGWRVKNSWIRRWDSEKFTLFAVTRGVDSGNSPCLRSPGGGFRELPPSAVTRGLEVGEMRPPTLAPNFLNRALHPPTSASNFPPIVLLFF